MSDAASGDPPIHGRSASNLVLAVLVVTALGSATALVASAHEGATGVVAQRMNMMKSMGDAMKRLGTMYRGLVAYDADAVREAANVIARHGGSKLTDMVPAGSLEHPSEAVPGIWEDWERFAELAEDLTIRAGALADASAPDTGTGDPPPASLAEFRRLGRVCSACHTEFRKEE